MFCFVSFNLPWAHCKYFLLSINRVLTLKCWTQRKAREWDEEIQKAMRGEGKQFIEDNTRFDSFAPERPNAYVNW